MDGKALMIPNGATLPAVCLKCASQQNLESRAQKFSFVPVWARFFGPLIQVLVMKKSAFVLPICTPCHSTWKKWNLYAFLGSLPGIALVMLGAVIGDDVGGGMCGFGMLVFLGGLITALVIRMRHVVIASKIDKTHTWLTRLHPEAMRIASMGG